LTRAFVGARRWRLRSEPMHEVISGCRSCGSTALEPILSLGEVPLADGLVDRSRVGTPDARYPLDVAFCGECSLVQAVETVSPDVLFDETYVYFSSFSEELLRHSSKNAEDLIDSMGLGPHSLVLELASNDGYMLRNFAARGIPVLGIDPAPAPAQAAREAGIPTLEVFFGEEVARNLRAERKRADIVIANNVLAHVPDLNGFVEGIRIILKGEGMVVIEVPYVRDLIDRREFDTIYHEHLCYFSVSALERLFSRHDLTLERVEHYPIHGGSLRLHVGTGRQIDDSVRDYLDEEQRSGLTDIDYYRDFGSRVRAIQGDLLSTLRRLKQEGHRIAAYGAAAKGTILLNSTGIGGDLVDFVVDRNIHKQGRLVPGVRIPIDDPVRLIREMPDYVLLLAWNFRDEILGQQDEYRRRGGKFIIPVPEPMVV
jgi:SAM-dependent methyltransferase